MEIKEFENEFEEQIKDLLVELQEYIIEIDMYNLNILSKNYREKYFDFMLEDCLEKQGKIFVAIENSNVLGFIAGHLENYDEKDKLDYTCPKKGIIAELIVSKNSRKNGVGQKLLKTMEDYFKSINCEFIQLDVFAYNENAKRFYFNNNYKERMITLFKKLN